MIRGKFPTPIRPVKLGKREVLTCFLCSHYQYADDRVRQGGDLPDLRKCVIDGKYKDVDTPSCSVFTLTQYFHCRKLGQRIHSEACQARQDKRVDGCSHSCKGYGGIVSKLLRKGKTT